jgi:hypothetical protein
MTLGGVSKEKTQTNLDPKTRKVTAGDITKLIPNATKDIVIYFSLASITVYVSGIY